MLAGLLDEVDADGFESVVRRNQDGHDRLALITAWINTRTWEESRDYHAQHRAALHAPEVRQQLTEFDDDQVAHQHRAILDLAEAIGIDRGYRVVVDTGVAEQEAQDAIERGDLPHLAAVVAAAPHLQDRPVTWAVATAVLLTAAGQPGEARAVLQLAVAEATPIQRRAHAVRLRGLLRHPAAPAGLDALIDILAADEAGGPPTA
jgi:hypothetical protein